MEESVKSFETLHNTTANTLNGTYYLSSYIFWYVTIANAVIFIIGVTGNIFVLVVVISNKTMITHMNILLCSLSVADLFVLLICQPAGMIEFYGKDRWFLGETLCKSIYYIFVDWILELLRVWCLLVCFFFVFCVVFCLVFFFFLFYAMQLQFYQFIIYFFLLDFETVTSVEFFVLYFLTSLQLLCKFKYNSIITFQNKLLVEITLSGSIEVQHKEIMFILQ